MKPRATTRVCHFIEEDLDGLISDQALRVAPVRAVACVPIPFSPPCTAALKTGDTRRVLDAAAAA